jgi:hypothetical protein
VTDTDPQQPDNAGAQGLGLRRKIVIRSCDGSPDLKSSSRGGAVGSPFSLTHEEESDLVMLSQCRTLAELEQTFTGVVQEVGMR